MKSTLRILFFVKGKCVKRNGKLPIQVCVTVDGDPVQFSIKQDVDPNIWDPKNGKAIGRSPEAVEINSVIETVGGKEWCEMGQFVVRKNASKTSMVTLPRRGEL